MTHNDVEKVVSNLSNTVHISVFHKVASGQMTLEEGVQELVQAQVQEQARVNWREQLIDIFLGVIVGYLLFWVIWL
jgi:diphthamide biosynthesis methyltransferase